MLKTGRLDPMGLFSSHGIKGKSDLQKMLRRPVKSKTSASSWSEREDRDYGKERIFVLPGCSSERKASASNYMVSVESMCKTLDVKLNEIPDWNCCAASIGYAEGGELPRHIMNARNIAISEKEHPGQDIVATCAACWLGTKETSERVSHSGSCWRT